MKCTQCGTEFEGKFCPECGRRAEQNAPAVQCEIEKPKAGKKEKRKKKKKPFFLRWWFILLVIIAVIIIALNAAGGGEKIVWDDMVLGDMLPEPPASKGKIYTNAADELWLNISDLSDKEFADYVEACKAKGFTTDADSDSYSYAAYNAEGYKLNLGHYGSDADMSIELEAPMEMNSILWPASAAGMQLPAPKSEIGKFSYEYDDSFFVYVGDTSKAEYAEYVKACSDMGFNVDYSKGEDYYFADNSEGWYVSIRYEGNNIMSVNIDAPDEELKDEAPAVSDIPEADVPAETGAPEIQEEDEEDAAANTNGIDPDFKAAMDSYEEFMDEYVAFMKKYMDNPNDIGLLVDYADYMRKYADFVEDFEKWENEEMNVEETAYYIEVQGRVSKKLLEVAQ